MKPVSSGGGYDMIRLCKVIASAVLIVLFSAFSGVKEEAKDFEIKAEDLGLLKDEPKKLLLAFTSSPSPAMSDLIRQLNREYIGLSVIPLPSFPMLGNSDHYFFCLKKTPSVFFFTGSNPDTHQPTDSVEKMNAEKMSWVVKLAYLLAFQIGENQERPVWKTIHP